MDRKLPNSQLWALNAIQLYLEEFVPTKCLATPNTVMAYLVLVDENIQFDIASCNIQ